MSRPTARAESPAVQMLERLEISAAIASGAAIHAMLYSSGSLETSMRLISKLITSG